MIRRTCHAGNIELSCIPDLRPRRVLTYWVFSRSRQSITGNAVATPAAMAAIAAPSISRSCRSGQTSATFAVTNPAATATQPTDAAMVSPLRKASSNAMNGMRLATNATPARACSLPCPWPAAARPTRLAPAAAAVTAAPRFVMYANASHARAGHATSGMATRNSQRIAAPWRPASIGANSSMVASKIAMPMAGPVGNTMPK